MGRTFVDVEVENYSDVVLRKAAGNGHREVRKQTVRALVDTGSALLCLQRAAIEALGLDFSRTAEVRTGNGNVERPIYDVARITILGRQCFIQVMEIPEGIPPLLGYIALENLDLVVDAKSNKVTTNPESGGKFMLDLL
jgi:clan AA aspartic protease